MWWLSARYIGQMRRSLSHWLIEYKRTFELWDPDPLCPVGTCSGAMTMPGERWGCMLTPIGTSSRDVCWNHFKYVWPICCWHYISNLSLIHLITCFTFTFQTCFPFNLSSAMLCPQGTPNDWEQRKKWTMMKSIILTRTMVRSTLQDWKRNVTNGIRAYNLTPRHN